MAATRQPHRRASWVVAGLLITATGGLWMYHDHVLFWRDHAARGIITAVTVSPTARNRNSTFIVQVAFDYGQAGKFYHGPTTATFVRRSPLPVGQAVTLLYRTDKPSTPRLAPFSVVWVTQDTTLSTVVFGLGVSVLLGCVGLAAARSSGTAYQPKRSPERLLHP